MRLPKALNSSGRAFHRVGAPAKNALSLVPWRSRLGQSWTTVSCDVTERYTPRTLSQYCQIKYGGPFVRLLRLQSKVAENPSFEQEEVLCACHSEKQSFGFVKKDPRDQVLLNLSGLSRAATGTRR